MVIKQLLYSLSLIGLGAAALAACSVDRPTAAGRPCSDEQPCGPGTSCVNGLCQDDTVDAGTADGKGGLDRAMDKDRGKPDKKKAAPDKQVRLDKKKPPPDKALPPPDKKLPLDKALPKPDKKPPPPDKALPPPDKKLPPPDKKLPPPDKTLPKPDQGCPTGTTRCAGQCVNTKTNFKHCGGCFKSCPSTLTNMCVNGKCSCGTSGGICSGDRDCVNNACKCIPNGLCTGCCKNNVCVFLGGSQDVYTCGKNGQTCKSCIDSNHCTDDMCIVGACVNPNKSGGQSCNDSNSCSHTDTCHSGTCKGISYSCKDSFSCTIDSCTGSAPPNQCKYTLASGYCLIGSTCWANNAQNPTNSCQRCLTSVSTSSWTTAAGCSSTTVSTLVPSTPFVQPQGVEFGTGGTIYVGDSYAHKVWTISGSTASVLAGTGVKGFVNGPVSTAQLSYPSGMAIASSGAVYYTDSNHVIRKIYNGQVTTLAGTGQSGKTNGALTQAQFYLPFDVAFDSAGALYVADTYNYLVRRIHGAQVSIFAGSTYGFQNGSNTSAKFTTVRSLDIDSTGRIYVADGSNHCIRMIYNGQVYTFAGICGSSGFANGAAATARFSEPHGVAVSASGKVYVADRKNNRIRVIANGVVSTLAGTGTAGYKDGDASVAMFKEPHAVAVHKPASGKGMVLVADYYNHKIRLIQLTGPP